MRDHLSGVPGKVNQQVKLFGSQVNRLAHDADQMRRGVDNKIAQLDCERRAFRCATQMGSHSRQQFLDSERLGHVVVCARIQRFNLGPLVVAN